MNLIRLILFLLIGVLLAQMMFYYPNLPATVATHFDQNGIPNGFMTKQYFVVFELGLLLLMVGEALLLPRLLEKMPDSWLNIPNKSYWLKAERRAATFANLRKHFEIFGVLLVAFFIMINQLVFRANIFRENLSPPVTWLILGVFIVCVVSWLIKFVSQFRIKN